MKIKLTTAASLVIALTFVVSLPVFAQYGGNTNEAAAGRTDGGPIKASASLRTGSDNRAVSSTTKTDNRMNNGQDRGGQMIDQRLQSLNQLLSRIQGMKRISDSDHSSLETNIHGQIDVLTSLKTKIDNDTSTTSIKTDVESITKSNRIFALVEPKITIAAAADRVLNIVTLLNTVLVKVQSRLSADATASASTSVQASLTDFTAKVRDAQTQANAAVAETASLNPDNGDKTIMASNTAALKDARTKIQTAEKDLKAAQKDLQTIVKVLMQDMKSLNTNRSGSTTPE